MQAFTSLGETDFLKVLWKLKNASKVYHGKTLKRLIFKEDLKFKPLNKANFTQKTLE